jgi:hypothetical protein
MCGSIVDNFNSRWSYMFVIGSQFFVSRFNTGVVKMWNSEEVKLNMTSVFKNTCLKEIGSHAHNLLTNLDSTIKLCYLVFEFTFDVTDFHRVVIFSVCVCI